MKKATLIIANAIIWAAVLLACAIALRGTGAFQDIQAILGAGAVVSMLIVALSTTQGKQTAAESK